MSPDLTEITVRGSFESRHPPERATVRLAIAHEGADRADVHTRTVRSVNGLTEVVRPLAEGDAAPVARWTTDRLHTWSDRPWDHEKSRQGELVHHAQARMQVEFRDLDAFARFLDDVGIRSEVAVEELAWALTEANAREHAREARRRAVHDAAERAQDYARAAGLSSVTVRAVADVGLLGGRDEGRFGERHRGGGPVTVAMAQSMSGGGPMEFAPADITVAATVEARFHAE